MSMSKVWCGKVKCRVYRNNRGIWEYSVECTVNKWGGKDRGIWEYSMEYAGNQHCWNNKV